MPAATRTCCIRAARRFGRVEREHPRLASRVLAHIADARRDASARPRRVGPASQTSGWGDESVATTRVLEALHYRGKLHVARRASGIKVYALAAPQRPRARPRRARGAPARCCSTCTRPFPSRASAQIVHMVSGTPRRRRRCGRVRSRVAQRRRRRRIDSRRLDWLARRGRRSSASRHRGSIARAIRSAGVGSPPVRSVLGLGLPVRSLHAARKAQARLLRVAAPVARRRHRLVQRKRRRHDCVSTVGFCARRRATPRSGASSTPKSSACATCVGAQNARASPMHMSNGALFRNLDPDLGLDLARDHLSSSASWRRRSRSPTASRSPAPSSPRGALPPVCRCAFRAASTHPRGIRRDAVRASTISASTGRSASSPPASSRSCSRPSCS